MVEKKKSMGHKKFSGHGSMTKAGRVRNNTPKIKRTGVNSRKKKIPRLRYKELYINRVENKQHAGQPNSVGARKHDRQKKKKLIQNGKV